MRKVLDSIIGNDSLKNKLYSDILSQTLSHAYIIEGKKGSGKHTISYLIAAALSCENLKDNNYAIPCRSCKSCKKILEGKSPDVITITREDKASIGVDSVRFLKNDVRVVPNDLDYKIYIIEDADTMTLQAQNAFLLTLEEPPSYVKFFLLCEDADSLLETVRSRSQILKTEPISTDDIDSYLQFNYQNAKQMKLSSPSDYYELIMSSGASIGRAIELLDSKEFKKTLEERTIAREFLKIITSTPSSDEIVSLLYKFEKKREPLMDLLFTVELAIRDLIAIDRTESAPLLFFYDRQEALSLSDAVNIRRLMQIYDKLKNLQDLINSNTNIRLTVTNFFSEINII